MLAYKDAPGLDALTCEPLDAQTLPCRVPAVA